MAKIWKRADRDTWVVDYRDGAGERRRLTAPTRDAAEQLLADKVKESREPAEPVEYRNITLAAYAAMRRPLMEQEVETKTARSYCQMLDGHVLPTLGRVKIRELRRRHVKALLAGKHGQGYAKDTVRLMRAALSSLLTDAVDDEIITANPALSLGRKKGKSAHRVSAAERRQRIRPMTWAQRDALLSAAAGDGAHAVLFHLLAKGGLRPGEAFALQPGDVDLERRVVRVERALSGGNVKDTKTHESRQVDLSNDLVSLLRGHLHWLKTEALRRGWGEPEWLFPNDQGKPLDESRSRKVFQRALRRAKLPAFRVYDLRHTFASLLLASCAPITYVSAQLGHANPSTTLRYYARWIPGSGHRWVDVLDHGPSGFGTNPGTRNEIGESQVSELPDLVGGPSRTRTLDPLIKSQLLYQLS
jgi:integrase